MDHVADSVPFGDFRAALAAVESEFSAVLGLPPLGAPMAVGGFSSPSEPRAGTLLCTMSQPDEGFLRRLDGLGACAVVVPENCGKAVAAVGHIALEAASPKYAFARLARALVPLATERGRVPGSRSPLAAVGEGAVIGAGSTIEEFVSVAPGSLVGEGCYLMRGSSVGPRVRLGRGCVLKENAVIGDPGFGFGLASGRPHARIPQLGGVEIGDDVEIGAGTTIGAGTLTPTRIGSGAKINNHVHIAHNCHIGAGALIGCHVSISGTTTIGERCWIAPGATLRNKIVVGDGATVGLGAVVVKDVPAGATVAGVPARVLDKPGPWYESETGTP
jgi:UDP-3-O-[3-hydroxymyristoyl] glucosamine N-acyltransferase LpxD